MSLKSKTLGMIAAFGLLASAALPAVAQTSSDSATATATVVLSETGQFAVSIANATLGAVNTAAGTQSAVSSGSLNITYTDTKSYRGGFFLTLGAGDFQSQTLRTPRAYTNTAANVTLPAGVPYVIKASNFVVVRNFNVVQGRFSGGSFQTTGYAIGDIGSTPSGNFPNFGDSTTPFDSPAGVGGGDAYHNWTSTEFNNLDGTPRISRGLPGPGTAGNSDPNGSKQKLNVELTVPAGQPADTYTSTLTITVIPAGF